MEEHGRKMHSGLSDSMSTMNRFSVNGAEFGTAMSNPTANHNQQDLDPYGYSFPGSGNSAQIGDDMGFDSMPPLNAGFSLVSSQSTGQEANYDYPDYMIPRTLGSTLSNDDMIPHPTAIYDSTGQPGADRELEEPTQASSQSGHRPDEDKLRKRIHELEDRRRRALLMVENMDSELTTLRKANEILRSYARS
ncbi:hypothetical protein MMC27_003670 [Xylographa pallens]|nr:hypothetical protein [Xylographa pallens]